MVIKEMMVMLMMGITKMMMSMVMINEMMPS